MRTSGRLLTRLLPALVVVAWLLLAGPLGQFTGKLGEVQSNDSSTFLPAGAESTRVTELQKKFQDQKSIPAIVVWEADGPIGEPQRAAAADALRRVAGMGITIGAASPPLPSSDGRALQGIVPLRADVDDTGPAVDRVREAAAAVPGTTVHVAGPAALQADLKSAFAGIDTVLLLVALSVVLIILLAVYRALLLPLVVILGAVLALALASAMVYALADAGVVQLDGQTQGIMFILVVGAATDYALLLAIRVREELAGGHDRARAVLVAWRRSIPPILASAFTVAAGLLALLFSDLNSNRALGPVATIGVLCALISALTFLPAALMLLGRAAYWPSRQLGRSPAVWHRIGALISRRPRRVWMLSTAFLIVAAAFLPMLDANGIPRTEVFLNEERSVTGQRALERHFPAGTGNPAVIIADAAAAEQVTAAAQEVRGVQQVRPTPGAQGGAPKVVDGQVELRATLSVPPDGERGFATIERLRDAVHQVPGADALVGGYPATQYDTVRTAERDQRVIIPVVVAIIVVILGLLLRSVLAPMLLTATVVLSFAATLGISALVFEFLFGFPGADPTVPLFGFVFLVALGVDYNIFLMTRVREEAAGHTTRDATVRGLVATGGVITSAGVVLAATFGALVVIPLVFLVQIAFIVSFGVLMDTLLVRSLLVPALVHDLGARVWWPARPGGDAQSHQKDHEVEPQISSA